MSYMVSRVIAERRSAVAARLEALLARGTVDLGDRYSEAEMQLAVVAFLYDDVRAMAPTEVPQSLRELFATFAYAAGARPGMSPEDTQARLEAFLEAYPARPELLSELQELTRQLEDEEREALATQAMAVTGAPRPVSAVSVGPKVASSPLAMRELHQVVGTAFR